MSKEYTAEERVTKRDDVIRKVRACLARAKDAAAGATEAETAARQAEALMRKYNLEMADVIMEELANPINLTWTYVRTNMFKNNKAVIKDLQKWPQWIAVPCAEMYDCHAASRWVDGEGKVIGFFGYKLDVDVCVWTYDYLLDCCRRASLKVSEGEAWAHGVSINVYRKAFREGMATEISSRLKQLMEERSREIRGTGMSLVLSKRAACEAKFGKFSYGVSQSDKASEAPAAFHAGIAEGAKVRLTPNPVTDKRGPAPAAVGAPAPRLTNKGKP